MSDSTAFDNHAVGSSVISVLDSIDEVSIISNCYFESNAAETLENIMKELPENAVSFLKNKDLRSYTNLTDL